jgi:2-polyprenyl-6-methoxyphenol hydroxylase-like FAD-dependent oxidoreductase
MSDTLGRRAVVVGAGIGGLSMAGALAKYFEQVEVLERDRLTASAASRPGTPQDRHPHGLLAGGPQALGEIFSGFERDLARAGAVPVKIAHEIQFERADVGVLPKRDFGISLLCASRPLIELVLRRRAEAVANIALRPECRATGLVPAKAGAGVQGIRFDGGSGRSETLEADLVVNASGRGALTLTLLDALGCERPTQTEIGVDISYATVVVSVPPNASPDWKLVLTQPDPPAVALHAVLVPTEDSHWTIAIADHNATARLETWDSFLEACRSLTTPWPGYVSRRQAGSAAAGCVAPGGCGAGPDRGIAGEFHGRGRLGARDALEYVDERRPRFPRDARRTAGEFRGSSTVRSCPFPRRRRRPSRPPRHDRSRPTAAASESSARTGHHATDRGGTR